MNVELATKKRKSSEQSSPENNKKSAGTQCCPVQATVGDADTDASASTRADAADSATEGVSGNVADSVIAVANASADVVSLTATHTVSVAFDFKLFRRNETRSEFTVQYRTSHPLMTSGIGA
jgi:hypothetical protein